MANNRGPNPKSDTVRALLARSGNRCAFPGCSHPVVNEKNQFVAQVCHISAASPEGQRFDPTMSDDERRSYDNLVIFCYAHHVETNNVAEFDVALLIEIKRVHEEQFQDALYVPPERVVSELESDIKTYWEEVETRNKLMHSDPEDIRMEIPVDGSFRELFEEVRSCVEKLSSITQFLQQEGASNFAYVHIGLPNFLARITVIIDQLEVRVLELELKQSPDSHQLTADLKAARSRILEYASGIGWID